MILSFMLKKDLGLFKKIQLKNIFNAKFLKLHVPVLREAKRGGFANE